MSEFIDQSAYRMMAIVQCRKIQRVEIEQTLKCEKSSSEPTIVGIYYRDVSSFSLRIRQ